jgi:hypothetical protein
VHHTVAQFSLSRPPLKLFDVWTANECKERRVENTCITCVFFLCTTVVFL